MLGITFLREESARVESFRPNMGNHLALFRSQGGRSKSKRRVYRENEREGERERVEVGWVGVWGTVVLPPGISISRISYHKSNVCSGGWSSRCWGQNAITGHGSRDQGTKAMPWWHPSKCEDDAKCGRRKKMLQWTLAVTFSCVDFYSNISPFKIIKMFNKIFNKIQDRHNYQRT